MAASNFISENFDTGVFNRGIVVVKRKRQYVRVTPRSPVFMHTSVQIWLHTEFSQNKENVPCMEKTPTSVQNGNSTMCRTVYVTVSFFFFIPLSSCVSFLKCEGSACEEQPIQTPPGPSECGAGPSDQPAAFLRRGQRSSGQTVCAPAECGLPQGQKLLPRSVTPTFYI